MDMNKGWRLKNSASTVRSTLYIRKQDKMFKFIRSIGHEMRMTTWPNRKQAWHDFVMVVEYTIFFMAFIMLFDWAVSNGMQRIIDFVLPFINKL